MGIFDSINVDKARNKGLELWKRKEALGKVKDQGLLVQIATDDADPKVRLMACEVLDDKRLWEQLARDADTAMRHGQSSAGSSGTSAGMYAWVRYDAFCAAFDQLVGDHELCCEVVRHCIGEMEILKKGYCGTDKLDTLVRIAAHDPGLIRQFWARIEEGIAAMRTSLIAAIMTEAAAIVGGTSIIIMQLIRITGTRWIANASRTFQPPQEVSMLAFVEVRTGYRWGGQRAQSGRGILRHACREDGLPHRLASPRNAQTGHCEPP
jgi:hypothetical protein